MVDLATYRCRIGLFGGGRSRTCICASGSKYRCYLIRKIYHRKAFRLWEQYAYSPEFVYLIGLWDIDTTDWPNWSIPEHQKGVPVFGDGDDREVHIKPAIVKLLLSIAGDVHPHPGPMPTECILKDFLDGGCSKPSEKLITQGSRYDKLKTASEAIGDGLKRELETLKKDYPTVQIPYHKSCVNRYVEMGKRASNSKKRPCEKTNESMKRTRSRYGPPFDHKANCLFCGLECILEPDPKHPERWRKAYPFREVERDVEEKIKEVCGKRTDETGENILERLRQVLTTASDLHAADACYHLNCRTNIANGKSLPGTQKEKEEQEDAALNLLIQSIDKNKDKVWDSVQLLDEYTKLGGNPSTVRCRLVNAISQNNSNLCIMRSPGYRSLIFHKSNTNAMIKLTQDEEEDDLENAIQLVAKHIKRESKSIKHDSSIYKTKVAEEDADMYCSPTFMSLLSKLEIAPDSPPSLLLGNMITSMVTTHTTPLQLALGIFFHRKKTIQLGYKYQLCCSYDETKRYKKSSAINALNQMKQGDTMRISVDNDCGLVQVIVDNFDCDLYSPNGLKSTHNLAMIETNSKKPPSQSSTIPRLSMAEMRQPLVTPEETELEEYIPKEHKPIPPQAPAYEIPQEELDARQVSYDRASNMDLEFLKVGQHNFS